MRRGILIVICDFLVSSMLAMMTGMVPAHTGGTGVGLDQKTTRMLLVELDNRQAELEALRAKLRETMNSLDTPTQAQEAELRHLSAELSRTMLEQEKLRSHLGSTPKNTGKLSPEELQKRLDAERQKLLELQLSLSDRSKDLAHTKEKLNEEHRRLADTARDLASERRAHTRTQQTLAKTNDALVDLTKSHVKTTEQLSKTQADLSVAQNTAKRQEKELNSGKLELQRLSVRLSESQGESSKLQKNLAFTSGKLQVRERDFAALQDKLTRTERVLSVTQLERTEAIRQKQDMEHTIQSAVKELSSARTEVEKLTVAKSRLESRLETTEEHLKRNSELRNDAISAYSGAVVQYVGEVEETMPLFNQKAKSEFFLPVVQFNGKPLLVGTFNKFAGDSEVVLSFRKMIKVSHKATPLSIGGASHTLTGPLLVSEPAHYAAAMVYDHKDCKPLPLLKSADLVKRGLNGLFLFKCTSLGKESAPLDGRCSIDLSQKTPQLFIRNAGRANNELRAEPGDFVLSREGEFVALVVSVDSSDFGRVHGARAQLFPNGNFWNQARVIPIIRDGNGHFDRYGSELRKIRQEYSADSRRR